MNTLIFNGIGYKFSKKAKMIEFMADRGLEFGSLRNDDTHTYSCVKLEVTNISKPIKRDNKNLFKVAKNKGYKVIRLYKVKNKLR